MNRNTELYTGDKMIDVNNRAYNSANAITHSQDNLRSGAQCVGIPILFTSSLISIRGLEKKLKFA